MKPLVHAVVFSFLAGFIGSLQAAELTIRQDAAVSIQILVPDGFEALPESAPEFKGVQTNVNPMGSDLLALFSISPRTSNPADFARQLDIQCARAGRGRDATKSDLSATRYAIYQQQEKLIKDAQEKTGIPGAIVLEPVHDSSDRHFSFVLRMPVPGGGQGCAASTVTLVRGRLWLLYVRSNQSDTPEDVAWVKSTAQSWVASILAANPSDEKTLAREDSIGRELFGNLELPTVTGAVAGGIGALIVIMRMKKKKNPVA